MIYTKEMARRTEFVTHKLNDLLKAINRDVKQASHAVREDYEVVFIEYNNDSTIEIDVTGTSLAELATTLIERVDCCE